MIEKVCPWCNTVQPARVTRADDRLGVAEWECSSCGGRWTVKASEPSNAYAFYPPDVTEQALFDDTLEPLFPGS